MEHLLNEVKKLSGLNGKFQSAIPKQRLWRCTIKLTCMTELENLSNVKLISIADDGSQEIILTFWNQMTQNFSPHLSALSLQEAKVLQLQCTKCRVQDKHDKTGTVSKSIVRYCGKCCWRDLQVQRLPRWFWLCGSVDISKLPQPPSLMVPPFRDVASAYYILQCIE